jgi:hypothetical protein
MMSLKDKTHRPIDSTRASRNSSDRPVQLGKGMMGHCRLDCMDGLVYLHIYAAYMVEGHISCFLWESVLRSFNALTT